ncbi:MAG: hypothetical protein FDZ75_05485 [Actinobacteria bacterium]|nr:MAG: hypothetical protein FDZ75_05485 [Actinomycetota bacterium]
MLALGGAVWFSRAGAFFSDPNQLGTFMSIALVMAFAMLVRETSKRAAVMEACAIGVTGLALVASASRTAWVGAAIGIVVVLLTAPAKRRKGVWIAAVSVGLAGVLFASPMLIERAVSSGDVNKDRSVATRVYMTQSTLAMIKDNPIWGTGLDAYPALYPAYRLPGSSPTIVELHQLPLALPVEMGLAGMLAEAVLVFSFIALYWRRRPEGWTVWEAATLAALLTVLVQTMFQYYLYFEYLWLVVALAVVARRLATATEEEA